MRKIEQKIYTYEELSYEAQKKALCDRYNYDYYHNSDDLKNTLKAFENHFPVIITNWEYDEYRGYVDFEFAESESIAELKGIRLMKHLWNNYKADLFKGKYYSKSKFIDGKHSFIHRYSKIKLNNECVLTGICFDDDILSPIYEFLDNPCEHTNFEDLMDECLDRWVKIAVKDCEYFWSEEYFIGECEANDIEFYEDGTRY